jgi:hypothetical protein
MDATTIEQVIQQLDREEAYFQRQLRENYFEKQTEAMFQSRTGPFRCTPMTEKEKPKKKRTKKAKQFIGIDYTFAEKKELRKNKEEHRLKVQQLKTTKQEVADGKQAAITSFFRPNA